MKYPLRIEFDGQTAFEAEVSEMKLEVNGEGVTVVARFEPGPTPEEKQMMLQALKQRFTSQLSQKDSADQREMNDGD